MSRTVPVMLSLVWAMAAAGCAAREPRLGPAEICPAGTQFTLTRYPDGQARELICWKRGATAGHLQHGPHLRWFPDGRQRYEANYVDGRLDGTATTWREDGSLDSELIYREGILIGCRAAPGGSCPPAGSTAPG